MPIDLRNNWLGVCRVERELGMICDEFGDSVMAGLIFGGALIIGSVIWWLSHSFDLEPSHKSFYAAMVALVGLGICVGSAISKL